MQTPQLIRSVSKIAASYQAKLTTVTEEEFMQTPPIGGWSYSEVYAHIFDSSLLSLLALEKCLNGDGVKARTLFAAKVILFFGMLPPGKRYKVPKRLVHRAKKIDKNVAQQFIDDFNTELSKAIAQIGTADPTVKVAHPRLGFLNATQWLRFIEIHLKHHVKQVKRIERSFAAAGSKK